MRKNWIECILDDLLILMTNGSSAKQYEENVGLPISRIETIWDEKVDFNRVKYVKESEPEFIEKYQIIKNDILLSHINSDSHLGKTAIYKNENQVFIHGINLLKLRPSPRLIASFLLYQFRYKRIKGDFIAVAQRAVNQSSINQKKLKSLDFILPPLPEQRAIVAKIEELFSDLDKGIADLTKAQAQLKVYRQAVLKKAFEGELTKEWREQRVKTQDIASQLPTADELLEQIKEERQKHYEQQIENWKQAVKAWEENGKEGKKPGKPAKYKFFDSPVRPLNLNIPQNWFFDCIGNTCSKTEYGSSSKSSASGDVPVLRMGNMQDGKIDWEDLKYSSDPDEIKQYILKTGDVLFNRTNSPELVGKTVQYNGERPAIFAGYLIRLNHIENIISGSYLNHFLNSHPAKVYGSFVKTDGVNQSNINGEKLSNYPLPICSLKEQHQIVQEIESRLSVCDKIEESITESLEKAKALRQSILKKAFEGTLLSEEEIEKCKQAADYEPASVLLERIKAEKKKKH